MKKLLTAITIVIAATSHSFAGPSWGFTLGNGAGFSWNGGRAGYLSCHQPQLYVVGPQYYRSYAKPQRRYIKHYYNAPVIMPIYPDSRCNQRTVIIPRAW